MNISLLQKEQTLMGSSKFGLTQIFNQPILRILIVNWDSVKFMMFEINCVSRQVIYHCKEVDVKF